MSYMSHVYDPRKHRIYEPINENKFVGNSCVARSSWEYHFMQWCDSNPNVIKWSSEAVQIPYFDPMKRKQRRYFPDFTLLIKDTNGKEKQFLVEIKPYKETIPPTRKGKKERTFLYEYFTYQTNVAKWNAAKMFCNKYGYEFKILTEKDIYQIRDGK